MPLFRTFDDISLPFKARMYKPVRSTESWTHTVHTPTVVVTNLLILIVTANTHFYSEVWLGCDFKRMTPVVRIKPNSSCTIGRGNDDIWIHLYADLLKRKNK